MPTIDVREELNRFRKKLLDLTANNRLLHYRKSKASTLQIVDELPNQIFDRLVNANRSFSFLARPDEHDDENDDQQPLLPAKTTIRLDLELPNQPGEGERVRRRYTDTKLQTDRDERSLENALKTIRQKARSAIEETGVNFLFLAVGFLRWYDRSDSQREHLAPLILIPVTIERDFARGQKRYVYNVHYNGQEIQSNLSLLKKLDNDFDLAMPEFEDGMTPEEYFEQIADLVNDETDWGIAREALVGFFSFRKLLMYQDLDSDSWPQGHEIETNAILRSVFEGHHSDPGDGLFLPDYDIDDHAIAHDIPLAAQADSSQHSALCDIAEGRSLVIEGPPGTGKSQTITNAIAWAISAGKTVLFVAEKLAALEVVQRNLEKLEVGDFCLQLHSDSAKPQSVIRQLEHRMNQKYPQPRDIQKRRDWLQALRHELIEYLDACKQRVGPYDEPVVDIFWRATELRSRGVAPPRGIAVKADVDRAPFESNISLLEDLAAQLKEIGSPDEHPWRWLRITTIHENNLPEFAELLANLRGAAEHYDTRLDEIAQRTGISKYFWAQSVARIKPAHLQRAQWPPPGIATELCGALAKAMDRRSATAAVKRVKQYRDLLDEVVNTTVDPPEDTTQTAERVLELLPSLATQNLAAVKLADLSRAHAALPNVTRAIEDLIEIAGRLESIGYEGLRSTAELHTAAEKHQLIEHPIAEDGLYLSPPLFMSAAEATYVAAEKEHATLTQGRDQLQERFVVDDAPNDTAVQEIRKTLRIHGSGMLRIFNKAYRQSRRQIRAFARPEASKKIADQVLWLERLTDWRQEREAFGNRPDLARTFGALFDGFETDWTRLRDSIRWCKTARARGLDYATAIDLVQRRAASEGAPAAEEVLQAIRTFKREIKTPEVLMFMNLTADEAEYRPLDALLTLTRQTHEQLSELVESSRAFRLSGSSSLQVWRDWATDVTKLAEVRESLEHNAEAESVLGAAYQGTETATAPIEATVAWLNDLNKMGLPEQIGLWLAAEGDEAAPWLKDALSDLIEATEQHIEHEIALSETGDVAEYEIGIDPDSQDDPARLQFLLNLEAELHRLAGWSQYCRMAERGRKRDLGDLIEHVETGALDPDDAADTYQLAVYDVIANEACEQSDALGYFNRNEHEGRRRRFAGVDEDLMLLTRREIAAKAAIASPPEGVSRGRVGELTEMGLIRHEITKQKRFCRLRSLMHRAGRATQALTPCFMMSPLSVAQFLPPGEMHFDLVIMDEASQIKPEDALGTIARAKQLIVVGDPKQLPPTSFFDKVVDTDMDPDEAVIIDDTESVLDAAMRAFPHKRRLKWHYRSQHESLIAFSNDRFYDGELVVFPSPTTDTGRLGVRCHKVQDATYANRCNPVEAEAVARAIAQHAIDNPEESLGVGTFNLKQSELIQNALDTICTEDSRAREAVDKLADSVDPLFIKNLESLQGDERDVIFISYTYGRDPDSGTVYQRFGPMTADNGWRRLNVLVTRARRRVEVFTSIEPQEIVAGPDRSRGVNAMKDFLAFAQTGRLVDRGVMTGREPDSPFEVAVARVVRDMGLQVVPQVGVAGYFIDIGVLYPDRDDEFLLGIECDGATYHSAKSTRDRDRLREEVIRSRGWEIHRIWSTDWFQSPESEIARLRECLLGQIRSHGVTLETP